MTAQQQLLATTEFVESSLKNAEGGHDWQHTKRVWHMALHIAKQEKADLFITQVAALLHDIADSKFHQGDETIGPAIAQKFLKDIHLEEHAIEHILSIIQNVSYRGGKHNTTIKSLEFKIVQDADRLDAIGAIGIARTFNYGGFKNNSIYDPKILPNLNKSKEEYKKGNGPSFNHFYEKLFLLKDGMHTKTAKIIARSRHEFMEKYVTQFLMEVSAKR